jgi:hypothetical protein
MSALLVLADGSKEWWLSGQYVTEEEFNRRMGK